MAGQATGTFEVKLTPFPLAHPAEGQPLGRLALEKQYHGDLEASARGEMLSAGTAVKGSAGYVAIERVTGTLLGRAGSFVLQHSGTMTRGEGTLSVSVVPDSGTGALVGLAGTMKLDLADGKHAYTFDFRLPDAPRVGES